jgi:hypothetical protein
MRNYPDFTLALGTAFQHILTKRADVRSSLESAAEQYAAALK